MLAGLALGARLRLAGVFAVAAGRQARRPGRHPSRAVVEFGTQEASGRRSPCSCPLAELAVAGATAPGDDRDGRSGRRALAPRPLHRRRSASTSPAAARPTATASASCTRPGGLEHARQERRPARGRHVRAGRRARGPGRSAVAWIGRLGGGELVAVAVGAASTALLVARRVRVPDSPPLVRPRAPPARAGRGGPERARADGRAGGGAAEIGLEPGTQAPAFDELDELLAPGVPLLLLFTSPHCGPCKALIPEAAAWQREHADALTVAFASDGEPEDVHAEAQEFELEHMLVDRDRQALRGVPGERDAERGAHLARRDDRELGSAR